MKPACSFQKGKVNYGPEYINKEPKRYIYCKM